MIERPQPTEVASYYFTYINQVTGDDPISVIENQLTESLALFSKISEEKSLHRYAPEKWSIRQVLKEAETEVGAAVSITAFVRYALGQGIDRKDSDFAAEVAAAAGQR